MTSEIERFEIWTAHRYGSQFGQPENRLKDELTEEQTVEELRHVRDTSVMLHTLLVVQDADVTRANRWLEEREAKQ